MTESSPVQLLRDRKEELKRYIRVLEDQIAVCEHAKESCSGLKARKENLESRLQEIMYLQEHI